MSKTRKQKKIQVSQVIDTSIPTAPFSLQKVSDLMEESKKIVDNKITIDIKKVCNYVSEYFFPLSNGNHGFYDYNENATLILDDRTIKNVYFNRMDKKVNDWYFRHYLTIYKIKSKIGGKFIENNTINLCGKFKYSYRNYDSFHEKDKEAVEKMKEFYKNIWCNGNEEYYNYLIDWIANLMKGNKNTTFLYLKGGQGIGKSRGTDFIYNCIGESLSLESKSDPLKTRFNKILFGKLFVIFEELEKSTDNEWETINANLKRLATSDKYVFEEKNEKAFQSDNIINIVVNTNREAVKDSEGRRVVILPVSSKKKGKVDYWKELTKNCFKSSVFHAFYCHMLEHNTTNFNAQVVPQSDIKEELLIDRLHSVYKFIKFNYIYKNKDLKISVKNLYDEYDLYCIKKEIPSKYVKKSSMLCKLREVGIECKKSNGQMVFRYTNEELKQIALQFDWLSIHDNDEIEEDQDYDKLHTDIYDDKPVLLKSAQNKIKAQTEEIKKLKAEIEALKKCIPKDEQKFKEIKTKNKKTNQSKQIEKSEQINNILSIF